MPTSEEASVSFHGATFVEIALPSATLFVDPVFSSTRRGRRLRGATRPCDYVLVTGASEGFDDVLDLLEDNAESVLVASERTCQMARSELGLGRARLLDLEPWERASNDAFRATAVPISRPTLFDEGTALLEDLGDRAGLGRLLAGGAGLLPGNLGRLPGVGLSAGMRALESLPVLGGQLQRSLRGRPGLGFLIESGSAHRILHLADGAHQGTDERELEDIASLSPLDVLLIDISSQPIDALVRAVRPFDAATVLLYRSQDPYARGRRSAPQPVGAYLEALREDLGNDVDVLHLREGDRYVLGASRAAADGKTAARPAESNAAAPRPVADSKPAAKA